MNGGDQPGGLVQRSANRRPACQLSSPPSTRRSTRLQEAPAAAGSQRAVAPARPRDATFTALEAQASPQACLLTARTLRPPSHWSSAAPRLSLRRGWSRLPAPALRIRSLRPSPRSVRPRDRGLSAASPSLRGCCTGLLGGASVGAGAAGSRPPRLRSHVARARPPAVRSPARRSGQGTIAGAGSTPVATHAAAPPAAPAQTVSSFAIAAMPAPREPPGGGDLGHRRVAAAESRQSRTEVGDELLRSLQQRARGRQQRQQRRRHPAARRGRSASSRGSWAQARRCSRTSAASRGPASPSQKSREQRLQVAAATAVLAAGDDQARKRARALGEQAIDFRLAVAGLLADLDVGVALGEQAQGPQLGRLQRLQRLAAAGDRPRGARPARRARRRRRGSSATGSSAGAFARAAGSRAASRGSGAPRAPRAWSPSGSSGSVRVSRWSGLWSGRSPAPAGRRPPRLRRRASSGAPCASAPPRSGRSFRPRRACAPRRVAFVAPALPGSIPR